VGRERTCLLCGTPCGTACGLWASVVVWARFLAPNAHCDVRVGCGAECCVCGLCRCVRLGVVCRHINSLSLRLLGETAHCTREVDSLLHVARGGRGHVIGV